MGLKGAFWSLWLIPVLRVSNVLTANITEAPVNVTAMMGRRVTLTCTVTGQQDPLEYLSWSKVSPAPEMLISINDNAFNTSKYSIDGRYDLSILDVQAGDQGMYSCALILDERLAHVTVAVPATEYRLYWENHKRVTVPAGQLMNLTCEVERSRPKVSFRWFRDGIEVTDLAQETPPTYDTLGYATGMVSRLPLRMSVMDHHSNVTCQFSLPGDTEYTTLSKLVQISQASSLYPLTLQVAILALTTSVGMLYWATVLTTGTI